MTEIRGRLLIDGTLVPGRVVVEGGTIAAVELNKDVAADAPVIAPGFIDLHVHGFGGCDPVEDAPGMALDSKTSAKTTAALVKAFRIL